MEVTEGATVAEPTSVLKKSPFCHRESPVLWRGRIGGEARDSVAR